MAKKRKRKYKKTQGTIGIYGIKLLKEKDDIEKERFGAKIGLMGELRKTKFKNNNQKNIRTSIIKTQLKN